MRPLQTDLSIFSKFEFCRGHLSVSSSYSSRPQGIEPLPMDKNLSFCEMLKETQITATPFYFGKENNETCVKGKRTWSASRRFICFRGILK
jgi:hypothetical protein